jgi:hypothetical protein
VAGYEILYWQTTQESFLAEYAARQLGVGVSPGSEWSFIHKLQNLGFYTGRLVWFAFPASLAAIAVFLRGSRADSGSSGMRQGFIFSVGVSVLYVLLFSLSDRRADRYIFPAYYLVGACGTIIAITRWPSIRRLTERLDNYHHFGPALLWLLLFCVNVASGPAGVPHVEL